MEREQESSPGESLVTVSSIIADSFASLPSDGSNSEPSKSWVKLDSTSELKVQAGYAEYYVLNKSDGKIYTALLSYDEQSCWFNCFQCCKPAYGYIPFDSLFPDGSTKQTRYPINICGFCVQIYDLDNLDVIKFHRDPHDVKNLNNDEKMLISTPSGLLGFIKVPRSKGGELYEIYNSNNILLFEIPRRVESEKHQYVFEVTKVNSGEGEQTVSSKIQIEGIHEIQTSLINMERIPAGDFRISFKQELNPLEKSFILAAAFFIRIREFSSYIPMVEAMVAAKTLLE